MMYPNKCSVQFGLILAMAFMVHVAFSVHTYTPLPAPQEIMRRERPGRLQLDGRRPPWVVEPRPPARPECTCDDRRLSGLEGDIANLLRRMVSQETQTKENKDDIQTLLQSNRQLQSQFTQVTNENQRLTRLIRSLRSDSSSLLSSNRQLQTENQRVLAERNRLQATLDGQDRDTDPVPVQPRSSAQDLHDVIGNREAEMVEMGLFSPIQPSKPQEETFTSHGRTSFSANARRPFLRPESEQVASSLLLLNRENANLARKIEQLEVRIDQQSAAVESTADVTGSLARQSPRVTSEMEDKVSQLERLVLVALQAPSGRTPVQTEVVGGRQTVPFNGRFHSAPSRGNPGSSVSAVERMSDSDLDALVNVVDSVQNKSPRKSAFSVASTRVTVGSNGVPKAIEFDHEFVNKGGDFKRRTNSFVCEHPGFYFITFTLRSFDGKYLGVVLMKNEEPQTAVYADSSERNIMQTQSLLLHLEDGDELFLRHAPADSFAVHSSVHRYVTFSGFLVYRGY